MDTCGNAEPNNFVQASCVAGPNMCHRSSNCHVPESDI
jgi:hypothetical protein